MILTQQQAMLKHEITVVCSHLYAKKHVRAYDYDFRCDKCKSKVSEYNYGLKTDISPVAYNTWKKKATEWHKFNKTKWRMAKQRNNLRKRRRKI